MTGAGLGVGGCYDWCELVPYQAGCGRQGGGLYCSTACSPSEAVLSPACRQAHAFPAAFAAACSLTTRSCAWAAHHTRLRSTWGRAAATVRAAKACQHLQAGTGREAVTAFGSSLASSCPNKPSLCARHSLSVLLQAVMPPALQPWRPVAGARPE